MHIKNLQDTDLGTFEIRYTPRDAILYALAVGARADQLDLVYERDLRVLPTYGCALGLWAVERAGGLGAYDRQRSLHASQTLVVHRPLPTEGRFSASGRVAAVYDKGRASIVDIEMRSDFFTATYSIYLPGLGGWGGDPGPQAAADNGTPVALDQRSDYPTRVDLPALYRLTGGLHPIHIDPEVARQNGFDRPILHGLCTLGIAAREVAAHSGCHPADLTQLSARLSAPVMPGQTLTVLSAGTSDSLYFEARASDGIVLKGGRARFANPYP